MSEAITETGEQPEVQTAQPLTCRLRSKEVIGRRGPIPNRGEVELENRSSVPVEIEYTMTPLQFLDLVVTGPNGKIVSQGHFSDHFSPTLEPTTLRIPPRGIFTASIPLFVTVPIDQHSPGIYRVQAVYAYNGTSAISEPVEVLLK